MARCARAVLAVMILGASTAACDAPPLEDEVGDAAQAICAGLYIANVSVHPGSVYVVSPESLLDSAEACGPQTLLLSVDRHFGTQIVFQNLPGIQIQKEKITKILQRITGIALEDDIDLIASSSTQVPTGAYERLEAYPELQVISWDLRLDACGASPDTYVTSGAVYRPIGVYFRIVLCAAAGGDGSAVVDPPPAQAAAPAMAQAAPDGGQPSGGEPTTGSSQR